MGSDARGTSRRLGALQPNLHPPTSSLHPPTQPPVSSRAIPSPMHRILTTGFAVLTLSLAVAAAPAAPRPGTDWPQFRGIDANGIAEGFSLPAKWNPADGTNILWKTAIPGLGLSSPIVWGDTVFLSTAIGGKPDSSLKIGYYGDITPVQDDTVHEWRVYALDKKTGAIEWQRTAIREVPKIKRH